MPPAGNSPGHGLSAIGLSPRPIPPTTRPCRTTGDNGEHAPVRRRSATGGSPGANKGCAPAVTRLSKMERRSTSTMWCPNNKGGRTTLPTCGSSMPTAIASFTAPAPLLGCVDCLSRVLGDRSARVCAEGMITLSSPYPTNYQQPAGGPFPLPLPTLERMPEGIRVKVVLEPSMVTAG
jgi:hypothetical protein